LRLSRTHEKSISLGPLIAACCQVLFSSPRRDVGARGLGSGRVTDGERGQLVIASQAFQMNGLCWWLQRYRVDVIDGVVGRLVRVLSGICRKLVIERGIFAGGRMSMP
jgi:hypothetical protein